MAIRVNPVSVHSYGQAAQVQFDAIRVDLVGLVDSAVGAHYFGPNAVDFKTRCGKMAADFAQRLSVDLGRIAEAVRVSTTNIATSLGGQPLSIAVNGTPIPLPHVPAGDGSVEVEVAGLEALKPVVAQRIESINAQLDSHLSRLTGTDWTGQAKDSAVSAVSSFTAAAKGRSDEARVSITAYIDKQINDVLIADKPK